MNEDFWNEEQFGLLFVLGISGNAERSEDTRIKMCCCLVNNAIGFNLCIIEVWANVLPKDKRWLA